MKLGMKIKKSKIKKNNIPIVVRINDVDDIDIAF